MGAVVEDVREKNWGALKKSKSINRKGRRVPIAIGITQSTQRAYYK
jgi:hypothetical protein